MAPPPRFLCEVFGLLAAVSALAFPAGQPAAVAGERFPRWTKELTLAGAYSISHSVLGSQSGVAGVQALPHLGLFVTEEGKPDWTPDWLRGNLELIAEATYLYIDSPEANHAGPSVLVRWVFAGSGAVRPYVEGGAGVLVGHSTLVATQCDVNFVLEIGAGVLLFFSRSAAVTIGYRFHHLSHADLCRPNPGLNSAVFFLGLTQFFQ